MYFRRLLCACTLPLVIAGCAYLAGPVRLYSVGVDVHGVGYHTEALRACVNTGVRQVGLEVRRNDATEQCIRTVGEQACLFYATTETTRRISLQVRSLGAPVPCDVVQRAMPQMRAAAAAIRDACETADRPISLQEQWHQAVSLREWWQQDRCGF